MDKNKYIHFIQNPDMLNKESLDDMRMITQEFPYFQTAWLLYAKNLLAINDVRFESNLKQAALRVSDRNVLFNLLHKPVVKPSTHNVVAEEKINKNPENKLGNVIQERLKEIQKKDNPLPEDVKKNNKNYAWEIEPEEGLIDFAFDTEGDRKKLDIIIRREVQRVYQLDKTSKTQQEQQNKKNKKIDLIDDFIEKDNSRISRETQMAISKPLPDYKVEENEDLISDTLAKIYIRQGHFEKALLTYEKLSLKYPKKNIYFASQIKMVEELILKSK